MLRWGTIGSAVVGVAVLITCSASAQDFSVARESFEQGEAHYEQGSYARALLAFERAYELMEGHPRQSAVLFNIARCFEDLGRLREARETYQRLLAESPAHEPARAPAEERIRELEAIERVTGGDGEAERSAVPSREPSPPPDDTPLMAGLIVGLVAVALGTGGLATFGSLALEEHASLEAGCYRAGGCSDQELGDLSAFSAVADASIGVLAAGAAAAVVFGVLFGLSGGGSEEPVAVIHPWADPSGLGLSVRGAF